MSEASTAVVKTEDKPMEYVPFGGKDKIKLSVRIVKDLLAVKTRSGKTCSDNDAIKFLMMCQARLLNPFEGDAFLIGYDGKDGPTFSLITAHQAFLKRAELNPEYDGMKSGVIIEEDGKMSDLEGDFFLKSQRVIGGWATVFFKNRKYPMHKRVRLERFQKAFGIWQDDSAGMICKCAEADALRSSFPTMLGGLYLKEEVAPQVETKTSAPIFTEPSKEEIVTAELVTETAAAPAAPKPTPVKKSAPKEFTKTPATLMRERIADAALTVEKVLGFMVTLGTIDEKIGTIEQLALEEPGVFSMLQEQADDIFNRIKTA